MRVKLWTTKEKTPMIFPGVPLSNSSQYPVVKAEGISDLVGVGLLKTVPGFHPAGALRATKFVPDKFVKPTVAMRQWLRSPPLRQIKNPAEAGLFIWRRG